MSMTPVKTLQKSIGAHRNSPASKYRPLNIIAADTMNSRGFPMFNSHTPWSENAATAQSRILILDFSTENGSSSRTQHYDGCELPDLWRSSRRIGCCEKKRSHTNKAVVAAR